MDQRSVQIHLKKHGLDSKMSTVRRMVNSFNETVELARLSGSIDPYRHDNQSYVGFSCWCGQFFPKRKGNALRHCKTSKCDPSKIRKIDDAIMLCCGRYITPSQLNDFFNKQPKRITQQFDYEDARALLEPLLPEKEKHDHTYTHMYVPLMRGGDFLHKLKSDFDMIHKLPDPTTEDLLLKLHGMAENWLLYFAKKIF